MFPPHPKGCGFHKTSYMKYKIGDKVKIKSLDWYETNECNGSVMCERLAFLDTMTEWCGKELTIDCVYDDGIYGYVMKEPKIQWIFTDSMIEGPVDAEPQEKMVNLENVCKWLRNNIDFYVETKYDEDFRVDIEQLLNDIHKAM